MRGKISFLILPILAVVAGIWLAAASPQSPQYIFPFKFSPILLSGTFGELRGNHFHSGVDIKTGGEVGKPIYAARDGYVYRLKESPYGFGRAIYLRHPDGQFTVYAHLNGFIDVYKEFVYQKQYATKQYEQEIYPEPNRFPVKQGDLIAYAGNSGSSTGPHLHFETRDPDERITNPLRFYQHIVKDNIPPTISHIAFEPMDANSRVNGSFEKVEFNPGGSPGSYEISETVEVAGRFGLEYHGWDILNGAPNHCGINYAKLYLDDTLVYEFAIDRYGFDEKKFINVHFDYQHYRRNGRKYQRCYLAEGNGFSCYRNLKNRGILELKDDKVHHLKLSLADSYENTTVLKAKVKRAAVAGPGTPSARSGGSSMRGYVRRNVLVTSVSNYGTAHFEGLDVKYDNGSSEKLKPAYREGSKLYYLLPLEKWRFPEVITDPVSGKTLRYYFRKTVLPQKNNIIDYKEAQLYFPFGSVFDTLQLEVRQKPRSSGMYSQVYEVGNIEVPLYKSFVLNIKPDIAGNPKHMVLAKKNRYGKWNYLGNEVKADGSVYASSGTFGEFCVMADSSSPRIKPLNFSEGGTVSSNQSTLRARLTDNFAGIDSRKIIVTLDGNWILAEFDAKTSSITHRLRDRPAPGTHKLTIIVYDNANNISEQEFTLIF